MFDQASATWISRAEVAEVAFAAQKKADRGPVTGAAVWVQKVDRGVLSCEFVGQAIGPR